METPDEEPRAQPGPSLRPAPHAPSPGSARRNAASAPGGRAPCAPAAPDRRRPSQEAQAGYQFTGSCAANQARLCAATVKPSGADGPGFVSAEAELFPTPELPPPPQSAQPLRAPEPSGDCHRQRRRASPARGRGVPTSKGYPPVPTHTLLRSSSPTPENQTPPINPHLSAAPRGCHAPGNLAQPGA